MDRSHSSVEAEFLSLVDQLLGRAVTFAFGNEFGEFRILLRRRNRQGVIR